MEVRGRGRVTHLVVVDLDALRVGVEVRGRGRVTHLVVVDLDALVDLAERDVDLE